MLPTADTCVILGLYRTNYLHAYLRKSRRRVFSRSWRLFVAKATENSITSTLYILLRISQMSGNLWAENHHRDRSDQPGSFQYFLFLFVFSPLVCPLLMCTKSTCKFWRACQTCDFFTYSSGTNSPVDKTEQKSLLVTVTPWHERCSLQLSPHGVRA